MIAPFRVSYSLRFSHCDPAGIGYYPRYFELCDAAIEDWTEWALGVSRRALHQELGFGLPTVDLRATFSAPSRLGDLLDIEIAVHRLGRSSIDLEARVTSEGGDRFLITYTQVLTGLKAMKPEPWPAKWRERLVVSLVKEISA